MNTDRAEALLACDVALAALDRDLVSAMVSLAAASFHVAITVADAHEAASRIPSSGPGWIVVADADRALAAGAGHAAPAVVWERGPTAFDAWLWARLWHEGLGPGAVVLVRADQDGSAALRQVLATQLRLRHEGALPSGAPAPGWALEVDPEADDRLRRVHASLVTLSDGTMAVVGDLTEPDGTTQLLLAAGAYGTGSDGLVRPLPGPVWTGLGTTADAGNQRWTLDLHAGLLVGEPVHQGIRSVRFAALDRPGIGALRAETDHPVRWPAALSPPHAPPALSADHAWTAGALPGNDHTWAETASDRATVSVAAGQRTWSAGEHHRVERVAAVRSGETSQRSEAATALAEARRAGFDELLRTHRRAWDDRWAHADIEIEGDPESQLAVRFALFHLLSCAATSGEAPVGARGLTGLAYAGHVFWDTDVFVLPTLAATLPSAARAVLEYRIRRLPAARALAGDGRGARFPWESADTGFDVTPTSGRDMEGRTVPIRTGQHEEHITSDVAWAALQYVDWTGDTSLLAGPGRALVTETARYWADRVRPDADGRGHLPAMIGPDEYHDVVDDNAYTNGMVRWHLQRAADLASDAGDTDEADRFRAVARSLVDGFDPATLRHEQFAGYWDLEPLLIADIAHPPVAADVLLGHDRVAQTQLIKQPDVLMLHHLLGGQLPAGSLQADLDFYLPRTAHGSSLSPAICAGLLARVGRPDAAMGLFDLAARLDLDDLTGTTAGGLHLATMGGVWQAVVGGFAGIRPAGDGLHVDPHLPSRWTSLRVRLRFRGHPVEVTIDHHRVTVDADPAVPVLIAGRPATAATRRPVEHVTWSST